MPHSSSNSPRVCLIGLDPPEYEQIKADSSTRIVACEVLPRMRVLEGRLQIQSPTGADFLTIDKVVYHGIFEDDHDFISGLALWNGPCLPDARAMMDCRLKLPCLVRALAYTEYGSLLRGFTTADTEVITDQQLVAKWGNWHCGENKERHHGNWRSSQPSILEPFIQGEAVRVVMIGNQFWQIHLEGENWLKSIHHADAEFMETDDRLVRDTRRIAEGFGLEIVANDYMITPEGIPHLLEVNHIPNVTRFPEIWQGYLQFVLRWISE